MNKRIIKKKRTIFYKNLLKSLQKQTKFKLSDVRIEEEGAYFTIPALKMKFFAAKTYILGDFIEIFEKFSITKCVFTLFDNDFDKFGATLQRYADNYKFYFVHSWTYGVYNPYKVDETYNEYQEEKKKRLAAAAAEFKEVMAAVRALKKYGEVYLQPTGLTCPKYYITLYTKKKAHIADALDLFPYFKNYSLLFATKKPKNAQAL